MKKRVMMKPHPSWDHLQRWTLSPSSPFNVEAWMCEPQATYPHPLPFVIQLLSRVRLFVTHGLQHISLPSPPLSPGVCSNACPLSQWCHPNISSPVTPFSLFQYQGLFQWVSSLHQVDKVVELNCLLWTLHEPAKATWAHLSLRGLSLPFTMPAPWTHRPSRERERERMCACVCACTQSYLRLRPQGL